MAESAPGSAGRACGLVAPAARGFCTVAAGWFPGGSPLLFSKGWSSWDYRALGGLCNSVAPISLMSVLGPGGQICGSSNPLLYILMDKPYVQARSHTSTVVWIQGSYSQRFSGSSQRAPILA
ncbi:hypothetical protein CHARACLAT_021588 [Characodon lateralis]|uniref:Uncharacterized protein n=1 Tax=Characodon lateralis TaxID=208331 RepID=A0ABU7EYU5_9TELE|nr:hypothetical protein [Characodon lateralis]